MNRVARGRRLVDPSVWSSAVSSGEALPERGRRTVNTVPPPGAGAAVTVPPWALVIERHDGEAQAGTPEPA